MTLASPLKPFPATGHHSTRAYDRVVYRKELRLAMDGKTTFISPQQFLESFVPEATTAKPAELSNILKDFKTSTNEWYMYDPLMKALNDAPDLCPGFKFVATPTKGDRTAGLQQSVNCGLYPANHAPRVEDEIGNEAEDKVEAVPSPGDNSAASPEAAKGKETSDDSVKGKYPAVNWSRIELAIEVKSKTSMDPFDDKRIDGRVISKGRKAVLGQILAYAQSIFDHQIRTHQFMVLIVADTARLIYIDRAGMFATTAFNYKTKGDPLIEFLWRFSRLSSAGRGRDPTAERIDPKSPEGVNMIERAQRPTGPDDYVTGLFKDSLVSDWPWWSLTFRDENDREGKERRFLVGKPHFCARGLAGRATQGYVALDRDDPKGPLSYLKDSWRVVHPDIRKEGDTLKFLNANNVPFVPTLKCHGDLGQSTITQDLWCHYRQKPSPDPACPLKEHQHYRLVMQEVGKSLSEFSRGYELVCAMYYCLLAHKAAYELGVLHRDISAGNILLIPKPKQKNQWVALLNDWELAKDLTPGAPKARQPDRTGTWQFLSANALDNPEKPIAIQDELESVFHVLLYMAIRFLPHNCPRGAVGKLLYNFFDDAAKGTSGSYGCGSLKARSMESGQISLNEGLSKKAVLEFWLKDGKAGNKHPINDIFTTLLSWFKAYYASIEYVPRVGSPEPPSEDEDEGFLEVAELDDRHVNVNQGEPSHSEAGSSASGSSLSAVVASTLPVVHVVEDPALLARKLDSHEAIIGLFREYLTNLQDHKWPKKDKTDDKKPKKGYNPEDEDGPELGDLISGVLQSFKRPVDQVNDPEEPSTPRQRRRLELPTAPDLAL